MPDDGHRVVILGGGFGGLYAAKRLGGCSARVTVVDRRNFHLFQPLLYQVATGGLSPGDIASPLRAVLKKHKNVNVVTAEATEVDVEGRRVILRDGEIPYDTLVVATGAHHHYFGNDQWAKHAPGLKTVEQALDIRRRIFLAFEAAERETDPEIRREWLRFAIVGAGPTGVELAGAVAELANHTLKGDFRAIDPGEAEIVLIEGTSRVLPPYPESLSAKAKRSLERLGVKVLTDAMVSDIRSDALTYKHGEEETVLRARTVLWAVGVQASSLGKQIAEATGVETDRSGRVHVEPNLTLEGHPEIIVIGDLACFTHQGDSPLPGVAPVAMQQGRYVAKLIRNRLKGRETKAFHYVNKGNLAVIGRNAAVADMGFVTFSGMPAWLVWVFIHIAYLIEYDSKIVVLFQWAINYVTRKRGARLITGDDPFPLVGAKRDA